MPANSITLIDSPHFSVNLDKYGKELHVHETSLASKVKSAAVLPFIFLKKLFVALAQAGYITLKSSGASFKYIVLNCHENKDLPKLPFPGDMPTIVYKVVCWIAYMPISFCVTTLRLLIQRTQGETGEKAFLSRFAGGEMNVSHIVPSNLLANVSEVPSDFKALDLLKMFREINFREPSSIGYMGGFLKDDEQFDGALKSLLELIDDQASSPETMHYSFYQNLRIAIHDIAQSLDELKKRDLILPDQLKELHKRHEFIGLILTQLARAASHWDIRDADDLVQLSRTPNQKSLVVCAGLHSQLRAVLAEEQRGIAKRKLMPFNFFDYFVYATYVSSLGNTVSIPGMNSFVSYLAESRIYLRFNYCESTLQAFFNEYNVNHIIATVQKAVKESQALRDSIIEWVKAQRGDWQTDQPGSEAQEEFLRRLQLDKMAEDGLTPQMMEWLLVSQDILNPHEEGKKW